VNAAAARAEFSIDLEDSRAFGAFSGDFNPLHVEPVAARRTQFGTTVVHGIHAALKAMDCLAGHWLPAGHEPVALTATFHNPIRTGVPATVTASEPAPDGRIRLHAEALGRPAFTLNIVTAPSRHDTPAPADECVKGGAPRSLPFPPGIDAGRVSVCADRALLAQLLPALAAAGNPAWIADLAATTRIVGMDCPGLDSIYSGFKLSRTLPGKEPPDAAMSYRIERIDPRFRLARLSVQGVFFTGTLDTFFRPPAVTQRSLADVMQRVPDGMLAGQRALVVGGSRGLGEIAAKILLAGGAQVTATYARGRDDAARLQAEAAAAGRPIEIAALDVSQPLPAATRARLGAAGYTHAYFFASPHIERNASGLWDAALYDRYAAVYVQGFQELVAAAAGVRRHGQDAPLQVLYPSSVFLDTDEPGFAEYCAAKAAGEMAARHMMQAMPVEIRAPRLPRMRTDQTSALMDAGVVDPFPVILECLRGYAA
jgi:hypothetical protein